MTDLTETTLTPEARSELSSIIIEALNTKSLSDEEVRSVGLRAKSAKSVIGLVVLLSGMAYGAVATFNELQAKPTTKQVDKAIEEKVAPVREQAKKADHNATVMEDIREDVDHVKEVQDYSLEQSAWQGEVLDHIAQKKKGKPRGKPDSLKEKERELLRK